MIDEKTLQLGEGRLSVGGNFDIGAARRRHLIFGRTGRVTSRRSSSSSSSSGGSSTLQTIQEVRTQLCGDRCASDTSAPQSPAPLAAATRAPRRVLSVIRFLLLPGLVHILPIICHYYTYKVLIRISIFYRILLHYLFIQHIF